MSSSVAYVNDRTETPDKSCRPSRSMPSCIARRNAASDQVPIPVSASGVMLLRNRPKRRGDRPSARIGSAGRGCVAVTAIANGCKGCSTGNCLSVNIHSLAGGYRRNGGSPTPGCSSQHHEHKQTENSKNDLAKAHLAALHNTSPSVLKVRRLNAGLDNCVPDGLNFAPLCTSRWSWDL